MIGNLILANKLRDRLDFAFQCFDRFDETDFSARMFCYSSRNDFRIEILSREGMFADSGGISFTSFLCTFPLSRRSFHSLPYFVLTVHCKPALAASSCEHRTVLLINRHSTQNKRNRGDSCFNGFSVLRII